MPLYKIFALKRYFGGGGGICCYLGTRTKNNKDSRNCVQLFAVCSWECSNLSQKKGIMGCKTNKSTYKYVSQMVNRVVEQ